MTNKEIQKIIEVNIDKKLNELIRDLKIFIPKDNYFLFKGRIGELMGLVQEKALASKQEEIDKLKEEKFKLEKELIKVNNLKFKKFMKKIQEAELKGIQTGEAEERKKIIEIIDKEIKDEKESELRKGERFWTYVHELRLLKLKAEDRK